MPSPTATATASPGLVSYENEFLGYRISLPSAYRRLQPMTFVSDDRTGLLGMDAFTLQTEQEQRDECLQDGGDLPSPTTALLLYVRAYRNAPALSATDWATTPRIPDAQPPVWHHKVVPLTLAGYDAVKLVSDNAAATTDTVIISAGDRMYEISPTMWPGPHRLEDVAATFASVPRQPIPTPSPSPAPDVARSGANALAASLARAFAAKDADAVARLAQDCRVGVSPVIEGTGGLPNSGGGGLSRSVALFTQALRQRFAAGDLAVTVATSVELDEHGAYVVRSEWREPDRVVRIDLVLRMIGSDWRWTSARQHFTWADLGSPPCIPYRSPWVSADAHC